ncbi:MAG: ABC transporter ATP-binding protein [Phycisphaerae bacterium]|nr:ABC transporter ATP-binding protein [Phycisphaerae bacterium]
MGTPAISVQRAFKKFRRGEQFDSLRDLLAARILRRRPADMPGKAEFWALRDITLEVWPGEAFGIIGPNGAGKSTMLKILAGIMRPNRGSVDIRGRVSALIELGAGFHGDLTGRENIYLNGSVLGMPRCDVQRKFDAIVDFAGIREFLDTPIKRYSSGMHARLGFAIAAHVDPQVLLVDEVLSVGDRVFRARCMDKMRGFLKQGAAVVFVSHDLGAVGRFCNRAMVLERGNDVFSGPAAESVGHYYDACAESLLVKGPQDAPLVRAFDVHACDQNGQDLTTITPGDAVRFRYRVAFDVDVARPSYGFSVVRAEDHLTLFETSSTRLGVESPPVRKGNHQSIAYDFQMNLPPGEYAIGLHVRDRDALRYMIQDAYAARVMVAGVPVSGGMVHLDPRVEVGGSSRRAMAVVTA